MCSIIVWCFTACILQFIELHSASFFVSKSNLWGILLHLLRFVLRFLADGKRRPRLSMRVQNRIYISIMSHYVRGGKCCFLTVRKTPGLRVRVHSVCVNVSMSVRPRLSVGFSSFLPNSKDLHIMWTRDDPGVFFFWMNE